MNIEKNYYEKIEFKSCYLVVFIILNFKYESESSLHKIKKVLKACHRLYKLSEVSFTDTYVSSSKFQVFVSYSFSIDLKVLNIFLS